MKLFDEIGAIFGLLAKGDFSLAFYRIGRHLPFSILVYNRAYLLTAPPEEIKCRPKRTSNSRIEKVDRSKIDAIAAVSKFPHDRIEKLLSSNAQCYLGAVPGEDYTSVVWTVRGPCYVRGMGFLFDFAADELYVFGMSRRPEGPVGLGRLVYSAVLQEAIAESVTTMYSLVEFSNSNAISLHRKMGYKIVLTVVYLRLFGINFCKRTVVSTGKNEFKVFLREPIDGATII
jgi:hypothetical protein